MIAGPLGADPECGLGISQVTTHQCQRVATEVVGQANLGQDDGGALDGGVDRSQQGWRCARLDHSKCVAGQVSSRAEHCVVQGWVNVAEKHATSEAAFRLAQLDTDHVGLLGAGDAAADQNQESTRVNGSAAEQGDGRSFDHEVTCQDAAADGVELEQRQCRMSLLLLLRHARQTMRK